MKKKIISAIILIVALSFQYFYKSKDKNNANSDFVSGEVDLGSVNSKTKKIDFLPTSTTGQVVKHKAFCYSYNEKHEQAEWVAYSLSKNDLGYVNRKRPFFEIDKKVKTISAHWRNYKKSGYDKGHLCPAADRIKDIKLYNQTFLTSNISPQKHDFNAGIWNRLEQKTRYWAKKYDHLYVITGGVLKGKSLKTIGKDHVSVPNYFYKILLDYTEPELKVIAFLLPHKDSEQPLYKFVVSIDEIEKITGIDFFPNLPDELEQKLESSNNYKKWSFQ